MRKKIFILVFIVMITTGCQINKDFKLIEVGQEKIKVEIADTIAKQVRGLGGRVSLERDEGILFIYPDYRRPSFWMKDMNFPLDIIWIKDSRVVDITPNVPVATSTQLLHYKPQQDINMVLEVNAGWTNANKVKIGDNAKLLDK